MKEILGNHLMNFFAEMNMLNEGYKKDSMRTYKGRRYEVYSISDELFDAMCNMSEKKFIELAGEDAWWRSAEGSNQGIPNNKYIINGKEIVAWDSYKRCEYYNEYCRDCEDRMDEMCKASDEDIESCCGERKYDTLSYYLCDEIGASQPINVCALAVDLAKYNGITMGELFTKYEG